MKITVSIRGTVVIHYDVGAFNANSLPEDIGTVATRMHFSNALNAV
jgi:hypothetical protein